ncbi:MAG: efflux RND transporter periplasmic adaptor subunit [Candidatus Hydrogenedentota bacterium]
MPRIHKLPLAFIAVLGVMTLLGCQFPDYSADAARDGEDGEDGEDVSGALAIPVRAEYPRRDSISDYFETTSRVTADHQVEVMTEAVQRVSEVLVEEGDRVERGQVLAELDKREAEASLRQQEIQVNQYETDYERARRGFEAGVTPRMEYENARFAYEQGKANLESQRIQLEDLTVEAPLDGIVTEVIARSGMMMSSGTPVCTIVDPETYRLVIHPPEREMRRLYEGQTAAVRLDAAPDRTFTATVSRINPSVDPASGTVRTTLQFEDAGPEDLLEAAFARVQLVMTTREDALLIPRDAILEEAGREYVYEVAPHDAAPEHELDSDEPTETFIEEFGERLVASRTEIETGLQDSYYTEVVEGLDEESRVVTMGHHNLRHGADVRIMDSEEEAEALESGIRMPADEALERAREMRAAGRERQEEEEEALEE